MARKRKEELFRDIIFKKALQPVEEFQRSNLPTTDTLLEIASEENTKKRNARLEKELGSYVKNYKQEVQESIQSNVKLMADRLLLDNAEILQRRGINLSADRIKAISEEFTSKMNRQKFMGKTMDQRLNNITKKGEDELVKGVRDMRRKSPTPERADALRDTVNGKRRGHYQRGKYHSFSMQRSSERLLVSEIGRSRREITQTIAEEVGVQLVRFVTQGDKLVCPVCEGIASGIHIDLSHFPGLKNPNGVFRAGEVPHTHPFCRCRVELVVLPTDILAFQAQGDVNGLLGKYDGNILTAEQSAAYARKYINKRQEMDALLGLPPAEAKSRASKLRKMVKESSLQGGDKIDRSFMSNIRKGQERAVLDLASVIGKQVDPEFIRAVGPENAARMLLADVKPKDRRKMTEAFQASIQGKVKASLMNVDDNLVLAQKHKSAARASQMAGKKAVSAKHKSNMTSEINRARKEAGQAVGYIEAQERMIKIMADPKSHSLGLVKFQSADKLEDFLLKYPNKDYKIFRGTNTLSFDIKKTAPSIVKSVAVDTAENLKFKAIKAGKFNVGGKKGFNPAGTLPTFRLSNQQESGMRFLMEAKAAILNAESGTGKTAMSIGTVAELRAKGLIRKDKKVLYITRNRLEGEVFRDYNKFVNDGKAGWGVSTKERVEMYGNPDNKMDIISHNSFLADMKNKRLKPGDYDAIIIDEFQNLGAGTSGYLKSFKDTPYKFGLSGTPVQDNAGELWPMIKWMNPKSFDSRAEYVKLFGKATSSSTFFQDAVFREINSHMAPVMMTMKQLELKPLVSKTMKLKVGGKKAAQLRALEKQYSLSRSGNVKNRIRRDMKKIVDGDLAVKHKALETILKSNRGKKKIIFVQNREEFQQVTRSLVKQGVPKDQIFTLGANTAKDAVDPIKNAYRSADRNAVIILDANMSAGHDFPMAGTVVHWTVPPNHSTKMQRTARAWRKGNQGTVSYDLITDTMEDTLRVKKVRETEKVFSSFADAEGVDTTGILSILRSEYGYTGKGN